MGQVKFLVAAAALILMAGCNPVRQVLKSPAKTDRVVLEWRKTHPLDSGVVKYLPGKDTTIIRERVVVDSVPTPYPVNHRFTERIYQDRVVVDTLKQVVRDTAMEGVLMRKIGAVETRLDRMESSRDQWRFAALAEGIFLLAIILVAVLRKRAGF